MKPKIITVSEDTHNNNDAVYVLLEKDIYNSLIESFAEIRDLLYLHYDRHDESVRSAVDSADDIFKHLRNSIIDKSTHKK